MSRVHSAGGRLVDWPDDATLERIRSAMWRAYCAVRPDVPGRLSAAEKMELACDANRLTEYGGLSKEDDRVHIDIYSSTRFQKWACAITRQWE